MKSKDILTVLNNDQFKSILITGTWGSGKTYLLEEVYKDNNQTKIISIQDCSDQLDITLKILHSMGGIEKKISDFTSFIPDISILGFNLNPASYFKKSVNYWAEKNLQAADLTTIVLDDWERSKIKFQDLFTFIENQKSKRKIICVANDDEIKKSNALKQAEKFFDIIIEIKQDFITAVDNFMSKHNLEHYRAKLLDFVIENPNLRTLEKIIIHLKNLNKNIQHKNLILASDEIFLFVSYLIKCQSLGIKFSDHRKLLKTHKLFNIDENKEELEKTKNELFEKFKQHNLAEVESFYFKSESYLAFLDYIQYGDLTLLNQHIKAIIDSKQDFNNQPDWRKLWEWRSLEDSEIKEIGEKAINSVFTGEIDIKLVLILISSIFDLLDEECITNDELDKLTKKIKDELLKDHNYIYHKTSSGVDDDIFDHGGAYGMAFSSLKNTDLLTVRNSLLLEARDAYLSYIHKPKEKTIEAFKSYMKDNGNYPYSKTFYDDPVFKENIFDSIEADEFSELYKNLPNKRKRQVNHLLEDRFRTRNLHRLKESESDFKKEMFSLIEKELNNFQSNSPTKINYKNLKKVSFPKNPGL